jgi:hypothetical protein
MAESEVRAPRGITVTRADLELDKQVLISLWGENLPNLRPEKLGWMYLGNPCGQAMCWIAKDPQGVPLGATALFPRTFYSAGIRHLGANAGDFVVSRMHRGGTAALALQKAAISSCTDCAFDFLIGLPNHKSEALMCRAGYKVIGPFLRMVKSIRSRPFFERRGLRRISQPLSVLVDMVLYWKSKESRFKVPPGYAFESPTSFDQRFDELWNELSSGRKLLGVRDSAYLNWRFLQAPQTPHGIFAAVNQSSGKLLGYIVFYEAEGSVTIADMLALDTPGALDVLLTGFLRMQRRRGVNAVAVHFLGPGSLVSELVDYGFYRRESIANVIVYAPRHSALASRVVEPETWHLFEGDFDLGR